MLNFGLGCQIVDLLNGLGAGIHGVVIQRASSFAAEDCDVGQVADTVRLQDAPP